MTVALVIIAIGFSLVSAVLALKKIRVERYQDIVAKTHVLCEIDQLAMQAMIVRQKCRETHGK